MKNITVALLSPRKNTSIHTKTIGIHRMSSPMMKKAVSSDAIGNYIGENGRSINIRVQSKVLPVLDHSPRTNFRLFRSLFSDTIFIAVVITGILCGLIQGNILLSFKGRLNRRQGEKSHSDISIQSHDGNGWE